MSKPLKAIINTPEFNIAVFSFLLHFVWEFVQAPTYAGMIEMNHWDGIKLCMSATFGDVGFALTAFIVTSIAARSRDWYASPKAWQLMLFLSVGIALTVGFEYYYTNITLRWTYSELMPLVPPFGTGLSPLLQWIIVPLLALGITRRQIAGAVTAEVTQQ
ncbi:hypothetical protein [Ahrensia sp. 13_GOM-1096m]|uniref:hypothetical protein n=1 Tax=Ahrensia sp. 13_GOM-1096m TaxID=1380380 RepID=UPI000478B0A0|nr:hypothetical protein [Ahrensia sp. 13_GOM-1096m]